MNDRQRLNAQMHYQPVDRSPIMDFGFWPETIELWHDQGLPAWVTGGHDTSKTNQFFGMDPLPGNAGGDVGLCPPFEFKVIEDRGDHEVVQQADGVRVLRRKTMSSIPQHEGHLLVDRESWCTHYKPRLDPDDPSRLPADLDERAKVWRDPNRTHPIGLWCGSLYGRLRDWMGMENISYVVYDDPAWFEEMVNTLADVTVSVLDKVLATGGQFDCAMFWEDMCFNSGPLLAPNHFKQYLVPQYKRITSRLHAHGVDEIWVDCDGRIDDLIPLWLDAGVNCMFPLEIGTWGADPIRYRQQYGRDLLMMGGFDKHILARSKREIEQEVHRLAPLVEESGYIGFCDHRVPPDVPLDHYMHYLRTARHVWGRDTNLKPLGELEPPLGAATTAPSASSTNLPSS